MSDVLPYFPTDPQLEQEILGSVVSEPSRFAIIAELLSESDFFVSEHRSTFRAMLQLDEQHLAIDALSLNEILKGDKDIQKAGGVAFFESIADGIHSAAPIQQWCRTLHEQTRQRKLIAIARGMAERATQERNAAQVVRETLQHTEEALADLYDDSSAIRGARSTKELCQELQPILEALGTGRGGRIFGHSTGFDCLDKLTNGFTPGELWIVAARPSGGKSALACEIALRQAKLGLPVCLFSVEMSWELVMMRLIAREAKVSFQLFRAAELSPQEWRRIAGATAVISELPIWIDDPWAPKAHELRWRIRNVAKRIGAKTIIVDYLQLLHARAENKTQEVTKCSMEMKSAAREVGQLTGAAVVLLSQLNRLAETEKPKLCHLRESGAIEQDADVVLLISDEDSTGWASKSSAPSTKIVDVAKQRNGPKAEVRLQFLPEIMGFLESPVGQKSYGTAEAANA